MPAGVHERGASTPWTSLPRFTGWMPSTSLSGSTASSARLEVEVPRERVLEEEGVDRGVGVELGDHLEDVGLGGVGGEVLVAADDAELGAVAVLHRHVVGRGPVVADQHRAQPRGEAPVDEQLDPVDELGLDLGGDGFAVERLRGHGSKLTRS